MHLILLLRKSALNVLYETGSLIAQATKLSQPRSLGRKTASRYEKITTLPDVLTTKREHFALFSISDVTEYVLFTKENLQDPSLKTITASKFLKEQRKDRCRQKIVARLHTGKNLALWKSKEGILLRTLFRNKQIVVFWELQTRLLHLCYYVKLSGHPCGKWRYHFLCGSF